MDETIILSGALEDPRPQEQKDLDHTHDDYLAGSTTTPNWADKTFTAFPRRYQSISGSCGPQAFAKALESFTGVSHSANPLYSRRTNFPSYGMYEQDLCDIAKNKGTCLEQLSPSQGMTDEQMNEAKFPIETPYRIKNYYIIPSMEQLNMDLLAMALEQGQALLLRVKSTGAEWQSVPVADPNSTNFFYHFVTCVAKNYGLYNGEKALCIDDSANAFSTIDGKGQRILTESFMKQRVLGIRGIVPNETYKDPLKFEEFINVLKTQ